MSCYLRDDEREGGPRRRSPTQVRCSGPATCTAIMEVVVEETGLDANIRAGAAPGIWSHLWRRDGRQGFAL